MRHVTALWDHGGVADSDAVRQRRRRAHVAGDHHLCRHPGAVVVPAGVTAVPAAGDLDLDPRAELEALAGRLAAVCDADPANALLARELRLTLLALLPAGGPGAEPDEEIAALFAAVPRVAGDGP